MIEVHNLVYRYPGNESPTIKGISFQVAAGEVFGFLGPSGAGKSTTQKLLIHLLTGFEGDVLVLNRDVRDWLADYYNFIGVGFELPNHYAKLTALENLQFFSSFYDVPTKDPLKLLQMVDLHQDANKRVEAFSKGMKMRLSFVRALLHDPQILFLDEPTAGLDPVNARVMKDIILDLKKQGKTVFLTTHNMHDADELCDRVAFIVNGEIKLTNTPKNLKLQGSARKVRVEYLRDGKLLTKNFDLDGLGENEEFLTILKNESLQSIHSEEASLEDIFIKVTGTSLT
ncbi:MAG TPA: ABC transporter ATP-binding protein [Pyrinomonadaceae bacterium]|nr:ABC transporter ATP-binding protein [Pyrinomonadaceae bacterium]